MPSLIETRLQVTNMPSPNYISGWKTYRDNRRSDLIQFAIWGGLALLIVVFVPVSIYITEKPTPKKVEAFHVTAPESFHVNYVSQVSVSAVDTVDERFEAQLPAAVAAWERSLGVKLRTPKLVTGYCSVAAVACAELGQNRITIQDGKRALHPKGILLHEIGHLLGVPHIEGDPLMDPVDHGAMISEPSELAVVIAKHALKN